MPKYLITGGCGFIGSHIADSLIARGDEVVILDNLSTGKIDNAPKQAQIIIGDIGDINALKQALEGIDGCFHLAAIVSVQHSIEQWLKSHLVNMTSSIKLLEALSQHPAKPPLVFASSSAVYGIPEAFPLKETDKIAPLSPYGADKRAVECQAELIYQLRHLKTTSLRLFNVYGPRQDPSSPYSGVISIFADKISRGEPITIFGEGEQKRDFIHVADVTRFFIKAMDSPDSGGQIYNLATGVGTSIKELAALIEELSEKQVQKCYAPARSGDIPLSIGDCSKAIKTFGIRPELTLQQGLSSLLTTYLGVS